MSQSFRGVKSLFSIGSFLFLLQMVFAVNTFAQTGEDLFKANCASCHKPDADYTGPALKGAASRWQKAYGDTLKIYEWIKNPKSVVDQGGYGAELATKWKASGIMTNQPLTDAQIFLVLNYVESYTAPAPPPASAGAEGEVKEEGGSWLWWVIVGTIFIIIATAVGTVRKQLVNANREKEGLAPLEEKTYLQTWGAWAWRNKVLAGFIAFFFLMGGLVDGTYILMDVGVYENYKPEQPIKFSHKIHAGDNKINCVYCHNSAEKSKHAGIPSTNVCMNCHKAIQKGTQTDTLEISKIYAAIGFNTKANAYTGKIGEPLKWLKVHNLPDHVYFNHSQHVVVGGLECRQCHGNMEKEDVARVMPHDSLAKINKQIYGAEFTMNRATLTMGWCIECHEQAVSKGYGDDKNGYYVELKKRLRKNKKLFKQHLEDDKVTVEELGGWECAKCHY